jgi:hypothetical protein
MVFGKYIRLSVFPKIVFSTIRFLSLINHLRPYRFAGAPVKLVYDYDLFKLEMFFLSGVVINLQEESQVTENTCGEKQLFELSQLNKVRKA